MAQIPDIRIPGYITQTALAAVQAAIDEAGRLGLTWRLRPGTVAGDGVADPLRVPVVVDGDDATTKAHSMVGPVVASQRVWCAQIPPAGIYLIGVIGEAAVSAGMLVARLRREATQSIANGGSGQFIEFDTADYMPFGGWSDSVDPDRFTPPWPGVWRFNARVVYASNATSRRFCGINANGETVTSGTIGSQSLQAPAAGSAQIQADGSAVIDGDYVGVRTIQNSGGPLNVTGTDGGCLLEAYWLGPVVP